MEGIQCYKTCPASSLEEAEQKLKSFTTRSGIRFKLNRPAVKFRLDDEAVKRGHVVDISISGCAIETEAGTPAYGDELLVTVYFADHPDFLSSFETQAKVVRTDDRVFAVQFVDVASQYQEQLYERLAHESGSSMVCPC